MNIPIIYFSSSGNTRYIANLIKIGLILAKFEIDLIPISKLKENPLDFEKVKVLGIGAPIYGLAFASNVRKWINSIPITKNKVKFFLFDTNAGIPGKPIKEIRKILERKGFEFIGAIDIVTPTRDSVFESNTLKYVKWSRGKIERTIQFGLKLGKVIKTEKGFIDWSKPILFGSLLRAIFKKLEKPLFKFLSKLLSFNLFKCNRCQICEKNCPTEAITFNPEPVRNKGKCILCFKCARVCPENAIYLKIFPNAKFFRGPKTVRGYVKPERILEAFEKKISY